MIRLAVIALAIPPFVTAVADLRIIPLECARLARDAGLPDRLTPAQFALALALLDRVKDMPIEVRGRLAEVRRCEAALQRLQ